MAILPIDLQTLYTQLDKIGKTQVQHQLSAQTAQEAQIVANKLKSKRKLKTVQETDAGSEHVGLVHERNGSQSAEGTNVKDQTADELKKDADSVKENEKEIITDPDLGSHIDISG